MLNRRSLLFSAPAAALAAGATSSLAATDGSLEVPMRVSPQMLDQCLVRATEAGLPGVSAVIGTRRGIAWSGCAGLADIVAGTPITADHVFGVGSITKVFVAVVVLQLVQEGRLSLTDLPAKVLDPVALQGIANLSPDGVEHATVAQLLAHTSGVPSWEDDPNWIRHGRGRDLDPYHIWGRSEALDYVRDHPATSSPGAAFNYSNSGYTILGLLIERVAHRTAAQEIRKRILAPLNLNDTYLEGFEVGHPGRTPHRYHYATAAFREAAGIAPAFVEVRPNLIDVSPSNLSVEWTAGGVVSSPNNLTRFAIALRDGRLLNPSSLGCMQDWKPARPYADMGHGLFRYKSPDGALQGHNGSVLGFTGSLWWAETGDVAVAVLANVGAMHAGVAPPAAYDVALLSDFRTLAHRFATEGAGGAP
jgi:D-alanyl-D-alanine carboxypeptidase